jgi:hypothetical protein
VKRAVRIRENIRKGYVDKKAGKSYGSGCADPAQKGADAMKDNDKKREKKPPCSHCGKIGHSTRRSQHCTFTTQPQAKGQKR